MKEQTMALIIFSIRHNGWLWGNSGIDKTVAYLWRQQGAITDRACREAALYFPFTHLFPRILAVAKICREMGEEWWCGLYDIISGWVVKKWHGSICDAIEISQDAMVLLQQLGGGVFLEHNRCGNTTSDCSTRNIMMFVMLPHPKLCSQKAPRDCSFLPHRDAWSKHATLLSL